ncbi:hypothetical protein SAMN05660337_0803 [Maridesulfovibrio ferrireducens]|uniref:Uncharacterized protein n=1 Tax=Maridesulfovibrio ferrireducens TaxID=246191 RepID=A0A1G9CUY2_9BACT|nr:hypothetical protein [Maridesulfovibrio ferrireducens]SDK55471.1 hypothetical protein SAMN05660337_0803 [Maridesulfovibrio ferrireducens]
MDSKKSKKIWCLTVALGVFVLIGTGLFFVNKMSIAKPVLNAGYKFFLGASAKSLDLNSSEINKLNRCFVLNKKVVDKAVLIIVNDDVTINGSTGIIGQDTKLKYKVVLEGKEGMKFTPQMRSCSRKNLVGKIVYNFERGAEAIAQYIDNPAFKNRAVEILDM